MPAKAGRRGPAGLKPTIDVARAGPAQGLAFCRPLCAGDGFGGRHHARSPDEPTGRASARPMTGSATSGKSSTTSRSTMLRSFLSWSPAYRFAHAGYHCFRRPGPEPGPITPGVGCKGRHLLHGQMGGHGVWVPAQGRDDVDDRRDSIFKEPFNDRHCERQRSNQAALNPGRHSGRALARTRNLEMFSSRFSDVQLHIVVRRCASPRNDCGYDFTLSRHDAPEAAPSKNQAKLLFPEKSTEADSNSSFLRQLHRAGSAPILRQLIDLAFHRLVDDRVSLSVPALCAAIRTNYNRDVHSARDVSLASPLSECQFLHCSCDRSAPANIANAAFARARHGAKSIWTSRTLPRFESPAC
jgi:hypothetical protein